MREKRKTLLWAAALAGLLLAALWGAGIAGGDGGETVACIYVDGALARRIDLGTVQGEWDFLLETPEGWNRIGVKEGAIRVLEADCPDGTCVRQGWLHRGRTPVVCLPHKVVIQLEAPAPEDAPEDIPEALDGVAG